MIVEWLGAAVTSLERLGFKSNPATNFDAGEFSKRSNLCLTVPRTPRVSTCCAHTTPMAVRPASSQFLVSACKASNRFWIKSTSEPERRDEEVDLSDNFEERPDLVSILCLIIIQVFQSVTTKPEQIIITETRQLTLS